MKALDWIATIFFVLGSSALVVAIIVVNFNMKFAADLIEKGISISNVSLIGFLFVGVSILMFNVQPNSKPS